MSIAVRKVELIEWLTRLQDEKLIQRIETLKKTSVQETYEFRIPKTEDDLLKKLEQSEKDIESGNVYSQGDIEDYFKTRFKQ